MILNMVIYAQLN